MPKHPPGDGSNDAARNKGQQRPHDAAIRGHDNGAPAPAPRLATAIDIAQEQSLSDREQTLSDREQTLSDADQTSSDADQTSSDADQTNADCDQLVADRDQAASDRDLMSGLDRLGHEFSRTIRQRAARQRAQTATTRLATASKRDQVAHGRDLIARARDNAADARDDAMAQVEAAHAQDDGGRAVTGAEIIMRASERRKRAARQRSQAAEQRALAGADRCAAAADREQAAGERLHALSDRESLARELQVAQIDALTGARTRAAGLRDLDHELNRSHRTNSTLCVAYVDVIGLKALNDHRGHSAGDALLKHVVRVITKHLRSYDLIIRLGGDEFLCAIPNVTLAHARERFSQIAAALAAAPDARGIRTGLAQLAPDESATELIARADRELIGSPASRQGPRAIL